MMLHRLAFFLAVAVTSAFAEPARIHVFVALVDNEHQGIAPVPAKIGNGDDPANNLYWGCDEALPPLLRGSKDWKLTATTKGDKPTILERKVYTHRDGKFQIVADAYRGMNIKECTADFFAALGSETPVADFPLAIYVGHDGLMEFPLPAEATAKRGPGRPAIALCCESQKYFGPHFAAVNAKPVLLTTQFMYPGGFLVREAANGLVAGEKPGQILQRAAAAYARNQKISVRAAAGVFTTETK
jgi:hypothetical protein